MKLKSSFSSETGCEDNQGTYRMTTHELQPISLAVVLVALVIPARKSTYGDNRPNIMVVMVDDMGYSDLGCYGSEIDTPHIDALASGGLRFSQFYNCGRCCPTRASLMTGLYPHRAGLGSMTARDYGRPGYRAEVSNIRTAGLVRRIDRGPTCGTSLCTHEMVDRSSQVTIWA